MPRRPAYPIIVIVALAGAMLTALAYWPGLMTWDAIRQYGQVLSRDFDDWHPPAMEWLWRRLTVIHAGPAPMLIVQLALEWGGLALLAVWAAKRGRRGLAAALLACGFMPFGLALTGEVLKDCLMAGALAMATAALAFAEPCRRAAAWRIAGVALCVFASTLRFNAFLATVPIAVALLPTTWRYGKPRLMIASLVAGVVMIAAMPLANRLLDARQSGVGLSLVIFDLGGITHFSGTNAFPPVADFDESDDPAGIVNACYDPSKWDRYAWWGADPCDIGFDNVQQAFAAQRVNPYRWWLTQIAAHPVAYVEHRLTHFAINTRLFSRDPVERAVQVEPPPNPWGYRITQGPVLTVVDGAAVWSAATPLGWPIVWIALALGLLIAAPALATRRLIVPLALSSFLYGTGYAAFSVASELRYHWWTMLAAALGAVIAGSDLIGGAALSRARWALALMPPTIALALGVGWRLLNPV